MTGYKLSVLGAFKLEHDKEIVLVSARKSQALLTFLACNAGEKYSREFISSLLWSDSSDKLARSNLRQVLTQIRQAVRKTERRADSIDSATVLSEEGSLSQNSSHRFLITTNTTIYLDPEMIDIDVVRFRLSANKVSAESCQTAHDIYGGELWSGQLLGSQLYDEWIEQERRRLTETYNSVLIRMLDQYEVSGDLPSWIATAENILTHDPYHEPAHQSLMRAYHRQGRRSSVLRQYKDCCAVLRKDLDIDPSQETIDLYHQLINAGVVSDVDSDFLSSSPETASSFKVRENISSRSDEPVKSMPVRTVSGRQQVLLISGFVGASFIGAWYFLTHAPENSDLQQTTAVAEQSDTFEAFTETKPSIAVLRFIDIDADESQRYFVSGLTEDLITELAGLSGLEVISPYSSFSLIDSGLEPVDIASRLNVRYLVRGTVQRSVGQLRVNASLIDASTGRTIWSQKYDKQQSEIFKLQDELTQAIASELSVKLTDSEQRHFEQIKSIDPDAYDLLLRGLEPLRQFTADGLIVARKYFNEALSIDPKYARAQANIALTYGTAVVFRLSEKPTQDAALALEHIKDAERLDAGIPQVQFAKAVVNLAARNYPVSINASRKAIELEPSYADGYAVLAQTSSYSGELESALQSIRYAIKLSPISPFSYLWVEAHILYLMRRFEESKAVLETVVNRNPSFVQGHLLLAAVCAQLGLREQSQWEREEVLILRPDFSVVDELAEAPYRLSEHRDLLAAGLRMAGFDL